jgi:hypothetical protein
MTNLQLMQNIFYGKAKMYNSDGIIRLSSYDTHVATFDSIQNKMYVYGYYSQTTAKHINAFLEYFGFDKCNKQQLNNYGI